MWVYLIGAEAEREKLDGKSHRIIFGAMATIEGREMVSAAKEQEAEAGDGAKSLACVQDFLLEGKLTSPEPPQKDNWVIRFD